MPTANLIYAINQVDNLSNNKDDFPLPDYRSLVHKVYNSVVNRFFKLLAVTANKELGQKVNFRDDSKKELSEGTAIILMTAVGTIHEW